MAKDIAICGESDGYSYFPKPGCWRKRTLTRPISRPGTDFVSPGRFTLSTGVGDELDLFYTDAFRGSLFGL